MKKKKIIIFISVLIVLIGLLFGIYMYELSPVTNNNEQVSFNASGSTRKIINDLYEAKLIKSKLAASIYVKLNKVSPKAGTHELNRNMGTKKIFNLLNNSPKRDDIVKVTLVEGKRLKDYVKVLSTKFDYTEEEIMAVLNDKDYLKKLISKYQFLTDDILNSDIYYPLEGYLYPATYEFYSDQSIESIVEKILDKTKEVLDNIDVSNSNYSIHEIMTMASIIENETKFDDDRKIVSQVIHKRIAMKMSLGMDVTTYYAVQKSMTEELTKVDLDSKNAYNTRNLSFIGLPVGPISNPRAESIKAALEPANTNYVYFYADVYGMNDDGTCNSALAGKLHFAENLSDFQNLINKYGKKCKVVN